MKINICMLLGLRYEPKMRVVPQIGIASYITHSGHDVTWVLSSEEIEEVQEATFNDIRIFLVPYILHFEGLLKVFNKALYLFRRMRFVFENCKKEKYNMIFVRDGTDGEFDASLALYIKRRYKILFVVEMSNPIEQSWEIHKVYSKHKYFWYFISKIKTHFIIHVLHKADMVLPTTKWMVDDFAKKGIKRSKMMPYPNGIDTNRFSSANGEEIKKRYGLKDSKVIIYIGTMGKERHLDILIHAFSKVRENKENVKLLMVGDGTDKTNLEKLANELGIKNDVIFTGQVHPHEVPNFIAAADVGVSPIPPLSFYKVSSPIKMFEYMAVSKPVVVNEEIPEQEEVIQESKGGILVKFEAESFAEGIIELLDDPERAREMGKQGQEWVVKNRSYNILARKLEQKYFEVLKTANTGA